MRVLLAALAASALLSGCGGESGDLLSIQVSGGPDPVPHTLVVTGDGRGSCDRGKLEALESGQVIAAREIERDVRKLADRAASYPPRRGARRLTLKTDNGVVRWSEGTPGIPTALPRAQLLALQMSRQLC